MNCPSELSASQKHGDDGDDDNWGEDNDDDNDDDDIHRKEYIGKNA